jgi:hypothetical protein
LKTAYSNFVAELYSVLRRAAVKLPMLRFGSKVAKKLVNSTSNFPGPQCAGMIHSCGPQHGVGIPERLNQKPVAGADTFI